MRGAFGGGCCANERSGASVEAPTAISNLRRCVMIWRLVSRQNSWHTIIYLTAEIKKKLRRPVSNSCRWFCHAPRFGPVSIGFLPDLLRDHPPLFVMSLPLHR